MLLKTRRCPESLFLLPSLHTFYFPPPLQSKEWESKEGELQKVQAKSQDRTPPMGVVLKELSHMFSRVYRFLSTSLPPALPYVSHRVLIEVLENRFEGMQ